MIHIDKYTIKTLADVYIAKHKLEEYDLAGWEWLHGFLRELELALIRGACEIQRYVNHSWKQKTRASARLSWSSPDGSEEGDHGVDLQLDHWVRNHLGWILDSPSKLKLC